MDQQLIDFIHQSKEKLISNKDDLQKVEKNITEYIDKRFLKIIPLKNISIHTRIKNVDSLGEKIIRSKVLLFEDIEPASYIDNLKDMIGLRLVCLLNMDEKKLYEEIQKSFSNENSLHTGFFEVEEIDRSKGYLIIKHGKQPETQKNGKEIFKMECLWIENGVTTPIELQIKSLVHMFWGELEHKLIYKNYAYDDHQSFYKDIMISINDLLSTIDSQLTTINSHLQGKSKKEQKLRAKDMLATEFYINLQTKLNALLIDYDVDFREVYGLLSELLTLGKNLNAILDILSTQISRLADLSVTKENFEFTEQQLKIETEVHLKPLGMIVSKLILSRDVVWRVLFGLYHIMDQNDTVKKSFKLFVERLNNTFDSVVTEKVAEVHELIEEDIANSVIIPAISSGVISAFEKYLKMDFFNERKKLDTVLETTEEYINFVTLHYENFGNKENSDSNRPLIDLLSLKLKIQILLSLSAEVELHELKELKTKLQTNTDWVFDIDYDKMEELFNSELTIENRNELIKVLNTKLKRDGETQNDPS